LDSPGDNLLAEFVSVVDAVQCAVAVQKEITARNAELPENRKMQFRIGINLGDVIEEEERIYGDGVNIAARLEGLSEPGGICISKTAFDHIESKLPYGYEFLGDQTVKNIAKPIGAYRVLMEPRITVAGDVEKKKAVPLWRRKAILVGSAALILVIIGGLIWNLYFQRVSIELASVEKMAYPLPDKPSIAVLSFKNISGDSEQDFLADGITNSIIGAISRVPGLFVISSESVSAYKGKTVKIKTVSEQLGVQNILEGAVQRDGDKLRVNVQLIDALTGRHLWAEKYDQNIGDIFSVQDNISKEVLTALQVKLVESEQARVWAKGTTNLDAYLKFLQAKEHLRSFSKNNMILARKGMLEAINLDPNYSAPYSAIGGTHMIDFWLGWGESKKTSIDKAQSALQKAIMLAPDSDYSYANMGHLHLIQRQFDKAVETGERAIHLNPNGDYNMVLLGITYTRIRRYEEALRLFDKAQRLNPNGPADYIHNAANAYLHLEMWDEAIAACKRALKRNPDHFPAPYWLASAYGWSGRIDEGRDVVSQILKVHPNADMTTDGGGFKYEADWEMVKKGLRKVGYPEKSSQQ